MAHFQRILVDVDTKAAVHPEFDRAALLARRCGTSLTVVDSMAEAAHVSGDVRAAVDDDMLAARRRELAYLAGSVMDVPITSRVLIGRSATCLIEEVIRSGHDLLVRSHARDVAAADSPYSAVNLALVEQCPCPVLLIGPGRTSEHPKVAGALSADVNNPLSLKVLDLTLQMARLERAAPMLVQTWVPFAEEMVLTHATGQGFAGYVEATRKRVCADLAQLTQSYGGDLSGVPVTLSRGEPDDVIPELIVREGIDLVVVAVPRRRHGLTSLFSRDRSERLLRRLTCSLLAVKPDGFVSPVRIMD